MSCMFVSWSQTNEKQQQTGQKQYMQTRSETMNNNLKKLAPSLLGAQQTYRWLSVFDPTGESLLPFDPRDN